MNQKESTSLGMNSHNQMGMQNFGGGRSILLFGSITLQHYSHLKYTFE